MTRRWRADSNGILDGWQIDYYDNIIGKNVLKQVWMEGVRDENRTTEVRRGHQEAFATNINILMDRFNQTHGVHTVQKMYGCEWNDETGETNGFDAYGYDGEDFLSLDLKEMRYISPVQQALATIQKWNDSKSLIENQRQYFATICIEWLKKYLQFAENSLKKPVSPQVSLLQKDSSSPVLCHATGFYPSGVRISWLKNGQDHYEDVDIGELVPNEDGTFQKTSTLGTNEWKQNQYICVVEHQSKTINTILTEKDIKTNNGNSNDKV
ncbi:T-cell surface glycoprotein CD1c [Triplophysa tibetana]|uniref:T-cell surface glycoprotein CD1c n=1 Tax=Triplophysa tibetana TaxID=1572043 RepID=A0A5A9NPE1_9TELE|nr:T-cell surface glycoprotein CD1c [Triplophysa tibetana]